MKKVLSKLLAKVRPVAKAVTAAVWGAIAGLLAVGFTSGFDWKAIAAAAGGAAVQAISVYYVRNGKTRTARKS